MEGQNKKGVSLIVVILLLIIAVLVSVGGTYFAMEKLRPISKCVDTSLVEDTEQKNVENEVEVDESKYDYVHKTSFIANGSKHTLVEAYYQGNVVNNYEEKATEFKKDTYLDDMKLFDGVVIDFISSSITTKEAYEFDQTEVNTLTFIDDVENGESYIILKERRYDSSEMGPTYNSVNSYIFNLKGEKIKEFQSVLPGTTMFLSEGGTYKDDKVRNLGDRLYYFYEAECGVYVEAEYQIKNGKLVETKSTKYGLDNVEIAGASC